MEKTTTLSNTVTKTKNWFVALIIVWFASVNSYAQTNPTAQAPIITENFGTTTFSTLAAHFAAWTVNSSPIGSQGNAESSTASGNATISAASGTQTTGGSYGYATSSNGRFYIQTSSNGTNGTNQLAGAINATGLGSIVIAYSIEMISANPRTIGVELQYRIGTSGAWTNVSGTVYSHTSADRSNGNTDSYNVTLPSAADNNAVVQIRWATWRGSQTGNSSGIAIDNISITASTFQSTYYFRSKQNGNWNSATTWEVSPDNSTWSNASTTPNYRANAITVSVADSVSITATDTLDQVIVNGILSYEDVGGSTPALYNGTGTELIINGKFYDAGPNSITWLSGATWSLGSGGYIIRNRGTSSNNWRDNYAGSISTIPATAHWIARKNGTDSPTLSSTGMYYPNLKIENYTGSAWITGTSSSFTGSLSSPLIKGNLDIGGNGSNTVSFLNSNTNIVPVGVNGHLTLKSGSTLRNQGTGFQVQGDLSLNGTVDYGGTGAGFILAGNGNQNLSGNLTFASFELNKSSTSATITLQSPATITGAFSFVKGYLITSPTNLLTFAHHASVGNAGGNNTNDSSFVKGPVRKIGNSIFTFPVGKGTNYQYIRISAPSDTTDAFTAEYFNAGQTLGTATDPTYDYISTCEYFTLDRTAGTSNIRATLSYDMFSCVSNLFPDPRVIGWDGSKWADLGMGAISTSPFGGNITTDGTIAQYGPITLGNNSNSIALPPDTAAIPSSFRYIKNNGQLIATNDSIRPDIKYYMNDAYPQAYFSDTAMSYVFAHIDTVAATTDTLVRIDVQYLNANSTYPVAQKADSTYTNYFLAHCPNGVTSVPQYQRLNYGNIYNRIDLIFAQNGKGLKYAFNVHPSGKPDAIKARYTGADSVKVAVSGQLYIYTALDTLIYNAPNAFKVDSSGNTALVTCNWQVDSNKVARFSFPSGYNVHLPLIIMVEQNNDENSPAAIDNLNWSTYYGGGSTDQSFDSHIDANNNIYVSGATLSSNYPVSSGVVYGTSLGGFDAIITTFSPNRGLNWSTYYGGTGDDEAYGIITDESGSIFFTGNTKSSNFPTCSTCSGFFQGTRKGAKDAFLVKLNSLGTTKQWATYFGGNDYDFGYSLDYKSSKLYLTGYTTTLASPYTLSFPTKTASGAYNQTIHGDSINGGADAFVAKFTNNGTQEWTSLLGGSGVEVPTGCVADNSGNLYVTGYSSNVGQSTCTPVNGKFPLCDPGSGAYVASNNGFSDAFISKFDTNNELKWSTLYGGESHDKNPFSEISTNCITLDKDGNIYIVGTSSSSLFPVDSVQGAFFQENSNVQSYGLNNGFVLKFSPNGVRLWATLYGGEYETVFTTVAADPTYNRIYVGGFTLSDTLPTMQYNGTTPYYWQPVQNGHWDGFIAVLNENDTLEWATYIGGFEYEYIKSINAFPSSVGQSGIITVGSSFSTDYPVANLPGDDDWFEDTNKGSMDIVISQFILDAGTSVGIQQYTFQNDAIRVYPNPSSGRLILYTEPFKGKQIELSLFSIAGAKIYSDKFKAEEKEKDLNFSNLAPGVYILNIAIKEQSFNYKFIKQ